MKEKKGPVERVTINIPTGMLIELDRIAADEHRSRSGQIQFFLSQTVARRATDNRPAETAAILAM